MQNTIYYVGGNKGGVGKSLWSTMLLDWLFKNRPSAKLLLIDTDLSGSDVGCRYHVGEFGGKYDDRIKAGVLDLSVMVNDETGDYIESNWSGLTTLIGNHEDYDVIINSAAAQIGSIKKCGRWFDDIMKMTGHDMVTYWLIGREEFGLEALVDYMNVVKNSVVHVVKNRREGKADSFDIFDNATETNNKIRERKGLVIEFPRLGLNLAASFQNSKMPFDETLASLKNMGDQVMFGRWKDSVWKQIEKTMG